MKKGSEKEQGGKKREKERERAPPPDEVVKVASKLAAEAPTKVVAPDELEAALKVSF